MGYFDKVLEIAAKSAKTDLEKHINNINGSKIFDLYYSDKPYGSGAHVETTRDKANRLMDYLEKKGYKPDKLPDRYQGRYEVIETIELKKRGVKGKIKITSVPYYDHLAKILIEI